MERTNSKSAGDMDLKKEKAAVQRKSAVAFVGEVKQELKRVEWTEKGELKAYTKIVLASIFLFGMLIYLIDLSIQGVLGAINFLIRAIVG